MTRDRRAVAAPGERGFAMVAVLLVLAMIGLLGSEFAYSMRLEARAAKTYKDMVLGAHLAEAGVGNALREIVGQGAIVAEAEDGLLTFYTRDRVALKRLPREEVSLGDGQYSYRITDESSRLDVNSLSPQELDRLLQLMGVAKEQRDIITDSIQDWIDTNDEHRANGAESDDYYLKLPVPYRARNGKLQSIDELLQIRGVTPELFHGTDDKPGLVDVLTVHSARINVNTASKLVLSAMGFSDAHILEIQATRQEAPLLDTSRFPMRNRTLITTTSTTYRIEATGLVEGKPRARVTTIVVVETDPTATTPGFRVLSWSGIR